MTSLFQGLPSSSSQPKPGKTTTSKDYLVATNDRTSVFVRRSDAVGYQDLVALLVVLFPGVSLYSVVVQTNELDTCAGRYVDIPPDLWAEISPEIQNIRVISRPPPNPKRPPTPPQSIIIHVQSPSGETTTVSLSSTASTYDLKAAIQNSGGTPVPAQLLTYHGQSLKDDSKLSEYGISDKATVYLQLQQNEPVVIPGSVPIVGGRRMRKPVIYLFSPRPIHVTVRVSLVYSWAFNAVYPSVPIKDTEIGQSIVWDVDTHEDHSLTTTTGTRVSYLFWEAEPKRGVLSPPLPPPSPRNTTVVLFDPMYPQVNNENSVVLRSSEAAEYLDRALSALCLHVEARTSFITYWLPEILKHDYVALHFLPQASYSHAAPLEVSPKPDIVTRVFMLFSPVGGDELVEWEGALTRAFESVDIWKGVVGVDGRGGGMGDEVFRVVEWGGMEVGSEWYKNLYDMKEEYQPSRSNIIRNVNATWAKQNLWIVFVHRNVSHILIRVDKDRDIGLRGDRSKGQRLEYAYVAIGYSSMPISVVTQDDATEKRCKNCEKSRGDLKVWAEMIPGVYPREW
ncbi:hypothetical protein EDD18DRAFT_1335078 [Armillaria luteobubalina]|uniref:Ubiquitin-like domain-containing protein n=1 Tax=Armillaria luteobubalina TaxID=153913 RepID=A0AA39PPT1_9AGAR|nr:hypothetical protein EDD18DRAFT_1335078 [Armillaria luteobubalina]